MEPRRARELISAFTGVKVCVLGDVMLDLYVRGRVARISPEAPVPVVEIVSEELRLGGAGNVANNIASLGGVPLLISVVGSDQQGDRLLGLLDRSRLWNGGIVRDDKRPTIVKSRVIAHNQQMLRLDSESRDGMTTSVVKKLAPLLRAAMVDSQAVLISDYAKGVITRSTIALARRAGGLPILVDPKIPNYSLYRGATIVTPNLAEAERMSAVAVKNEASLERAAARIMSYLRCPHLLITRGEEGMSLFERATRAATHLPARAQEVYDVTGAGDTVIATLALARASGATWVEAATLANHAAGIVVRKLGAATVSRQELIRSFSGAAGS